MNAHMHEQLLEIARQAGAIINCPNCSASEVCAFDKDADSRAYAMATNAWKEGAFRSASREETMEEMKSVIFDANHRCPVCQRDQD